MNLAMRPKSYGTFADFERDELRPLQKIGFSMDDLEAEATFNVGHEELKTADPEELDFG